VKFAALAFLLGVEAARPRGGCSCASARCWWCGILACVALPLAIAKPFTSCAGARPDR
jgi:hypothetical protein